MKIRIAVLTMAWVVATAAAGQAAPLFQDSFSTPGTKLDLAAWTTEIGPASLVGRTQLADWVSPGSDGQFVVGAGGAELALNTFNPTGLSLYGTHGKTLMAFQPTSSSTIEFTTRMQLTSLQPGLVFGMYLAGCPGPCATQYDQIGIELLTNLLQPGPLQVQLNRYANQPQGVGNGGLVDLPGVFDPLAAHDWTIRWSLDSVDYLVDGMLLSSVATFVPQGPMHLNEIAWGPDIDLPLAFSGSLQPTASAADNQRFVALMRSVTVSDSSVPEPVPEPASVLLLGIGLVGLVTRRRRQ